MINTPRARRGIVSAPHHLAAQSGLDVLRAGGNALEAMLAAAATIAVVYPHMNGIGGDGFWLVRAPGAEPIGIDACGRSGARVDLALYARHGLDAIPARGPLAANTVAGTVSGWAEAQRLASELGGHLPWQRLLEDAIHHAEHGVPVTAGQHRLTVARRAEMGAAPGFERLYTHGGKALAVGASMRNAALAETLRNIARDGPQAFYSGALARRIAADLARVGAPIDAADLAGQRAQRVTPLSVRTRQGRLLNLPPPTQGLASLMILALFDRLRVAQAEDFEHVHGLIEATKQAFLVRDREITDPQHMTSRAEHFLHASDLDARAGVIDREHASPWPRSTTHGDTVWMGAIDRNGVAVSFIQSVYWEFGSGVVLEDTGIQWQNRGSSFQLDAAAPNALLPGRKPFHTLNPAMAELADGRVMSYGAMGGEGQPQTQAAVFSRYAMFGQGLQEAVSAPRWLLGRTWGEPSTTLKLESRFDAALLARLRAAGHAVQAMEPFTDLMGHAGAVVAHADGMLEGAADPRSDGTVAAF